MTYRRYRGERLHHSLRWVFRTVCGNLAPLRPNGTPEEETLHEPRHVNVYAHRRPAISRPRSL